MNVLVIGGISFNTMVYLDQLPQPAPQTVRAKHFHETLGSTGAGKALNLQKLGFNVTLHGLIGEDIYGDRIRQILARNQVTAVLELDPAGTKRHLNLMSSDGARISIFLESGSPEAGVDSGVLGRLIQDCDLVVLNILNYARVLIPAIAAVGKQVWCDIHDYDGRAEYHRDFIEAADMIQLSSDALPDFRPFMQALAARGKSPVICTHGRNGATGLGPEGQWIDMPVLSDYERVDTNGAGDAFFAGVLLGHRLDLNLERCLRLGTIVSGLCITSRELAHPDLSTGLLRREYRRHYGEALPI